MIADNVVTLGVGGAGRDRDRADLSSGSGGGNNDGMPPDDKHGERIAVLETHVKRLGAKDSAVGWHRTTRGQRTCATAEVVSAHPDLTRPI